MRMASYLNSTGCEVFKKTLPHSNSGMTAHERIKILVYVQTPVTIEDRDDLTAILQYVVIISSCTLDVMFLENAFPPICHTFSFSFCPLETFVSVCLTTT